MAEVKIIITGENRASGAIKSATDGIREIGGAGKATASSFGAISSASAAAGRSIVDHSKHAHGGMTALEKKIADAQMRLMNLTMAAALVSAPFIALGVLLNKGLEAVDDYQQSVIKTAAIITSLQGGENVAENYRQAKEYAEGLQDALMLVDARTSLNLTNLQQITEEMVKQGVVLDYNNKSQLDAFTALANAVAVYSQNGTQEIQVRQEVRALMMGEVDANSQLASMLQKTVDGPLRDKVKQWKESGTLVDELGKRLIGFSAASGDISQTWSAIKSTFETIVTRLLRIGFADAMADIVGKGQEIAEWLKGHEDLIGNKIRQGWMAVKGLVEGVSSLFVDQTGALTGIGEAVGMIVKGWGLLLTAVFPPLMERLGAFGRGLWETLAMLGNLAGAAMSVLSGDYAGAGAYLDRAKANFAEMGKATVQAFRKGLLDEIGDRAIDFMALDEVNKSASKSVTVPKVGKKMEEETKAVKKALKAAIPALDRYAKSIEDLGREQLRLAESGLSRDLERQSEYFERTGMAAANLSSPIRSYMAVLDQVYGAQIKAQQEISAVLEKIGADQAARLRQEVNIENVEKTESEARLKGWQTYYDKLKALHASALEEMKKKRDEALASQKLLADLDKALAEKRAPREEVGAYEGYMRQKDAIDALAGSLGKLKGPELQKALRSLDAMIRNLPAEVMEDGITIISAEEITAVESGFRDQVAAGVAAVGQEAATAAGQVKLIEDQMKLAEAAIQPLQDKIVALGGIIASLDKEIALSVKDEATKPIATIQSALDALLDKTITVTVNYVSNIPGGDGTVDTSSGWSSNVFPGRATGGPVSPFGTYWVGERGPELLRMGSQGGQVIPNEAIGGGQTVQFNGDLNFNLPNVTNQSTARDLAREALPEIQRLMRERFRAA